MIIVLTDRPGREGLYVTAVKQEGNSDLQLYDYVRIIPPNTHQMFESKQEWIGQITRPNLNVSMVTDNPFDPSLIHALYLTQSRSDTVIEMAKTIETWEIQLLGEYDGHRLTTLRRRPQPGSRVERLDRETTLKVLELPKYDEKRVNAIGYLLNADDVPLCVNKSIFRHHMMISGGTGSGKSNTGANLVYQAARMGFTVFLYDAKPDYTLIDKPNSDESVKDVWDEMKKYGLQPIGADNLVRVAIYGIGRAKNLHYEGYQTILSFRASDFDAEWLGALFFTGKADYNQYEEFVGVCKELRETKREYSLDDVLEVIRQRSDGDKEEKKDEEESKKNPKKSQRTVHKQTAEAIIRKVERKRKTMPWLDSLNQEVSEATEKQTQLRFEQTTGLATKLKTQPYMADKFISKGKIVYIDLADVDADSYALFLGYFFRENQRYLSQNPQFRSLGILEFADEAHRIFTNDTRYSDLLEFEFNRTMMEGRSLGHGVIISLQNASQVPSSILNNINSHIVMRQNNREVAKFATQTMGVDFADQSISLAPGQALCRMFGSTATVLAQMAPSPYELERSDNV